MKATRNLALEEWNEIIPALDSLDDIISFKVLKTKAVAETKSRIFQVSLTGNELPNPVYPNVIMREFKKLCKLPEINQYDFGHKKDVNHKTTWSIEPTPPYSYVEHCHCDEELKCWSYDVNSAFAYAMLGFMPNTKVKPHSGIVKDGEIGFDSNGGVIVDAGCDAEYIFPLIPSPFAEYISKFYKLKAGAKTKEERSKYKAYLNIPTGCLYNDNIFIRNTILHYSNRHIRKYIDENTVYCNVDCIVSIKPRPDIPIGDDIGWFKLEHNGDGFKYKGLGVYQWIDEDGNKDIKYRGVSSSCIDDIDNAEGWTKRTKYIVKEDKTVVER